jgi:protoheme IX farnesyltransferase
MKTITAYLALCRVPISLFVTGSAVMGRIVASPVVMERTRHRPLPAGMMSLLNALIASFAAMLAGLFLLGRSGLLPFIIGVLAMAWYNGLYTWLKRRTAFAAVYGAPVGMAAPAIGWVTGGGSITDPRLAVLALLFFLWQVPHFWMLLLRSGDDYERAGLPSLTKVFPRELLSGITVLWLIAAAAASLLLPLFGMVRTPLLYGLLVLSVLLSSAGTIGLLRRPSFPRAAFPMINLFIAALMVLISVDALLVGHL